MIPTFPGYLRLVQINLFIEFDGYRYKYLIKKWLIANMRLVGVRIVKVKADVRAHFIFGL